MAKRKTEETSPKSHGIIEGAGTVISQPIVETLEKNYMPYAMSVIVSRAIPEIDGFKPSHRKLLYTMYKMGLMGSTRTKSANIVGQTMKLNPHGDQAIYDTMVRLTRGYEALLHPYIDSKGNFGKAFSRDMAWAAARYTEAKLDSICQEVFRDIDKDTVDFVDNYDGTMKEPTLLPVTFPTILVNYNTGIAVGMASSICSFNLREVCETTIALIRDPNHKISDTLLAPDFASGGIVLYDKKELENIYRTGRGSFKIRSRYTYDKSNHCIDITEIPPTTTVEAIIDKIVELVKQNKLKEIADIRDETGLDGLKITIDLKRGVSPEKLMQKLFALTPLEDTFSCNFNVLIAGVPRLLGIAELISEWTAFRIECIRRRTKFDLDKKKEKLHLLKGLSKILLDIDKAIRIIRDTESESDVIPNLMIGFGIDETQAEFVAEIKLRHLNREYIIKRTEEIEKLKEEIADLEAILQSKARVQSIIINELKEVAKKYGKPRKSIILYDYEEAADNEETEIPDYPVHIFLTKEGYFKKITPQSLRMSGEQKLKEGDAITQTREFTNAGDILFFTDKCQVYKCRAGDFEDTKASVLGDYLPAKLSMDEGENVIYMIATTDYSGYVMFFYENGKAAKVPLESYATKTNRKKLINAYSDKSRLVSVFHIKEDIEVMLISSAGKILLVNTGAISPKVTRNTAGVAAMSLKKNQVLTQVKEYKDGMLSKPHRHKVKTLPGAGALPTQEDLGEQLML